MLKFIKKKFNLILKIKIIVVILKSKVDTQLRYKNRIKIIKIYIL